MTLSSNKQLKMTAYEFSHFDTSASG